MIKGPTFERTSSSEWPSQQLSSKYTIQKIIGKGRQGIVYKGFNMRTKEIVAIKEFHHGIIDLGVSTLTLREIEILKSLHCDQIVSFREVMYGPKRTYIVMEYMQEDLVTAMVRQCFSEVQVKEIMFQVLKGLAFLHNEGIVHRDIKPDNILLTNSQIKLSDFGMAKHQDPSKILTPRIQNHSYRAPEVFLGQAYDEKVDLWSAGVLFIELLLRFNPFRAQSEALTFGKILKECGSPNEENWPGVSNLKNYSSLIPTPIVSNNLSQFLEKKLSPMLINLIDQMITLNPAKRISAEEALVHPYFKGVRIPRNCNFKAEQGQKKVRTNTHVFNDQEGYKIIVISKLL